MPLPRRCRSCRALIASTSRRDRVFCSTACRVSAHRRRYAPPPPSVDLDRLIAGLEPAVAEVALVTGVAIAARDDWRAAAFLLSRRWPERWGRRVGRDNLPDSGHG